MRRINRNKTGFRVAVMSDGGRVRKSSRMLSYRININGVCRYHLFCRVDVRVLSRAQAMSLRSEVSVQVLMRLVGKFRMQCIYSGGRTVTELNRNEDFNTRRHGKEVLCVEEVIVEESGEDGRKTPNGGRRNEVSSNILTGIGRRVAPLRRKSRTRKRRMVNVEGLYLFNVDTGTAVGRQVERGTRNGMDNTENLIDLLMNACSAYRSCIRNGETSHFFVAVVIEDVIISFPVS